MSLETAWYRGRTITGLQVGEPYPSTQVVFFFWWENYPDCGNYIPNKSSKNNSSWLIKSQRSRLIACKYSANNNSLLYLGCPSLTRNLPIFCLYKKVFMDIKLCTFCVLNFFHHLSSAKRYESFLEIAVCQSFHIIE